MKQCSNRQGILRIQSGTDKDWVNILKKIYNENIPNNIDHVYDSIHVNGFVSYD